MHRQMSNYTEDEPTFDSSGKLHAEQRHCQLAAVIRLAAAHVTFLCVEIVEVDLRPVVADTDRVDNATWRTCSQLLKQEVCQQEMTCHVTSTYTIHL